MKTTTPTDSRNHAAPSTTPDISFCYQGSVISRLIHAYTTRVEVVIKTITELFKTLRDVTKRETLAKQLANANQLKLELVACRHNTKHALDLLASEIRRCGQANYINIHNVYNRESPIMSGNINDSTGISTFDVKSLAKEYLRISKLNDHHPPTRASDSPSN